MQAPEIIEAIGNLLTPPKGQGYSTNAKLALGAVSGALFDQCLMQGIATQYFKPEYIQAANSQHYILLGSLLGLAIIYNIYKDQTNCKDRDGEMLNLALNRLKILQEIIKDEGQEAPASETDIQQVQSIEDKALKIIDDLNKEIEDLQEQKSKIEADISTTKSASLLPQLTEAAEDKTSSNEAQNIHVSTTITDSTNANPDPEQKQQETLREIEEKQQKLQKHQDALKKIDNQIENHYIKYSDRISDPVKFLSGYALGIGLCAGLSYLFSLGQLMQYMLSILWKRPAYIIGIAVGIALTISIIIPAIRAADKKILNLLPNHPEYRFAYDNKGKIAIFLGSSGLLLTNLIKPTILEGLINKMMTPSISSKFLTNYFRLPTIEGLINKTTTPSISSKFLTNYFRLPTIEGLINKTTTPSIGNMFIDTKSAAALCTHLTMLALVGSALTLCYQFYRYKKSEKEKEVSQSNGNANGDKQQLSTLSPPVCA